MRLTLPLLCCILPVLAWSGETPIPAAPTGWVTDAAGFMSPQAVQALNRRLGDYERSTGRQVFVYVGTSTGGVPLEDWAVKAFKTWKVGRKGLDNGVALFVMRDDRTSRIEVGYGLEGQLTDVLASRILDDTIKPRLLANDPNGAITSGAEAIVSALDGGTLPGAASGTSPPRAMQQQPLPFWQIVLYWILGIALVAMLITHPSFTIYLLINILTNSARGGYSGGSSGGGFGGGGGGRSGGGGASGSW
jgi:uncharacterized protein